MNHDLPESKQQQLKRNFSELLQELRVAQAGVQILFGFLLAVTFTDAYANASEFQRGVHLVVVLLTVASIALLTAPAAWHRILFRQGQRERILQVANRLAVTGMACLAAAMSGTVLLILDVVVGTLVAVLIAVATAIGFVVLWFVTPARQRQIPN